MKSVLAAIAMSKTKLGASPQSIRKYVAAHSRLTGFFLNYQVKRTLNFALRNGYIKKAKGARFKLAKKALLKGYRKKSKSRKRSKKAGRKGKKRRRRLRSRSKKRMMSKASPKRRRKARRVK